MKKILDYIETTGCFTPPQYIGGYDSLPFTHNEYNEYTEKLFKKLKKTAKDLSEGNLIKILIMSFKDNNKDFILRYLCMGEEVYQLLTKEYYERNWPEENYD